MKNEVISIINWFLKIFNICMESGVVPEDWKAGCIVSVYRRISDRRECAKYRGIGVLSIPEKIYGRILVNRVK